MRFELALVFFAFFVTLIGPAKAQDGLRSGAAIAFEPGDAYSVDKVPLRSDAKKLVNFLGQYEKAPTPKAMAVSQDGLQAYGFWERADRTPRTSSDVQRMALQHCEFHAGIPCRLIAVDNFLARGEPPAIEALPKSGLFEPMRMPFWSTSSISEATGLSKYIAESKPKALAIAPADGAKYVWATGDTLESARSKALADCLKRIEKSDIACVIFVEGNEVVYGSPGGIRQARTGAPTQAKEIMLVYVGAFNCAPCAFWERIRKREFLDSPTGKKIVFREVKAGTYDDTRNTASWPDDLKWIRDAGRANSGTPRFIVVVDGKVVRNRTGNWDQDVLPYIEMLVSGNTNKG